MQNKITWWGMRANQDDREMIRRLARRLKLSKSDAVRFAISRALEALPQQDPTPSQ